MGKNQVTWIVRNQSGQVKGPYTTEAILQMIGDGVFSGQESISKLPDGRWMQISKEPDFYDKLLEALEGVVKTKAKKQEKVEIETVIIAPPPLGSKQRAEFPNFENLKQVSVKGINSHKNETLKKTKLVVPPQSREDENKDFPAAIPISKSVSNSKQHSKSSIIDLSSLPNLGSRRTWIALKVPLLILVLAAVIAISVIWESGSSDSGKIHLIPPGPSTSLFSDDQIKRNLNEALFNIEQDTFDSYLLAENKLVSLVEGAPNNIEVRALLCMVYRELWPYARQDTQDIKTISALTQSTRAINIISPLGQVCEVVKLITGGRYREARSAVESTLETSESFSMLPVLFEYKAELLVGEKDFVNSVPYYEKSTQLWDKWLHPQVKLAELFYEKQNFTAAASTLQQVLKRNPNHREGKFILGVVEYRGFKNTEAAFTLLSSAYNSNGKVPPLVESQGLFALAEIYANRNEKGKALSIAQKAYMFNSSNSELRQLVVRLGGSDKVINNKEQNNELLFIGDQYIRQGDFLAAQAEFKAAFELDPRNGTAAMKAAKCLWQLNQSYEAIEWLTKAIKAEPNSISAYVLKADYLSQRFDFGGATIALANATRISPNNYEVLRGLAWLEFRKNNMLGALNYGSRAAKIYDGDIETFILLSKANSLLSQSIVPLNKKEIERKENAAKDSIRYATKAVELDMTNPEAQINYAKTIAIANGVDSGISYLNELIKRYSYTLDYQLALAEIYKTEDRWTQSNGIYEKVTEMDSKNKRAWLGLGESKKALGLNDKALKAFLQAAVLDPTDGEALFQAGRLYLETSRYEESIQQLKRVQRLSPFYPRTNYYIGRASFASGDFNAAMEAASAEKKMNPNIADSYILAAEVHASRRQFQECASEYSLALKLRAQVAEIYVKAAQCYRQSGSLDVAEDMLSLAAARESGYADIYREQGAIYELKGDARSAATAYNKYIGLSPNAPDRDEITNRLNRLGY
jgi:tetratricopeptide (TPR) repeat protein